MLVIGTLICAVFFLIVQIINRDLRGQLGPTPVNKSNVSLSNLLSDSLVNSWLEDSSRTADWNDPRNQLSEREAIELRDNSKFSATYLRGFTNATKESFLESLLSPSSFKVKPDWSVILGTFEHYDDEHWDDYLTKIGVPYLVRLLIQSISETITISRMSEDEKKDTNGIDKKISSTELETNNDHYDLRIETTFWPFSYDSFVRLGEPILEHDVDGTDSLNTFFFATPRLLIQDKIKDNRTTTIIRHFYEEGVNSTVMEKDRMAIAIRYLKRVE